MMRVLWAPFFVFSALVSAAQSVAPVYRSREDSVAIAEVQKHLTVLNLTSAEDASVRRQRDSLMRLNMRMMSEGIVRYRTIYKSDPAFTSYKDLVTTRKVSSTRTLSIDGRGRSTLPDSIYLCANLEELELVNWKLSRLPAQLKSLKKLQAISLLNCTSNEPLRLPRNKTIKELVIRAEEPASLPTKYRRLRALSVLDLSRNGMTSFPRTKGCRNLNRLLLTHNALSLDDLAGRQSKSVVDLNLNGNKIASVPAAIGSFTSLRKLNLANNRISDVDDGLGNLKHLEELSFYKNKLKTIPEAVYGLQSLQSVDLYYNEIEVLSPRITGLSELEILYLANNKVYALPDNLGELTRLRELYLHHNRLSNVPSSIGDLTHLQVLRVNDNMLLEFPSVVLQLKELQNLDVSYNQMQILPVSRFEFHNLKILALVGNPWDEPTKATLPEWANSLRQNKTIVHLNTFEDVVEK